MAIHRGIQSVLFFYLSCAPCTEVRYRKKRKEEAQRARAEREALEAEAPDEYRHPSPSSTNPFWQTEIALGPTLLTHDGKRKPASQVDLHRTTKPASRLSSNTSRMTSSVDLPGRVGSEDGNDERWNYKLYQRQDEELWGSSSNFDGSQYGDTLRRPPTARTKDSARSNFQSFRNPPVNDQHPAIVTRVTSREEVMWMMQPPPVAEVMNGKERASRSRSDSGNSRMAAASSMPLSRSLTKLLKEQALAASNASHSSAMSRQSSAQTSDTAMGQRHDRSRAAAAAAGTSERDFALGSTSPETRAKRRPSPISVSRSSENFLTVARPASASRLDHPPSRPPARKVASRPQLSSIASDSLVPTLDDASAFRKSPTVGKPNQHPNRVHRREGIREEIYHHHDVDDDDDDDDDNTTPRNGISHRTPGVTLDRRPLKFVQDLTPGSTFLNTQILTSSPVKERRTLEDVSSDDATMLSQLRPELFDSWYTDNFELPKWIHEHTKREVQQRWSMDL